MRKLYATVAAIAIASPAFAHTDLSAHGSALAGLAHPLMGSDHLLAILAVGVLAGTQGRAALWALPAAFVAAMAAGIGMGYAGAAVPFTEPLILLSLLVLALLVGWTARLPLGVMTSLVALFGLAHGSAHGLELGSASALPFSLGVLSATALLHAAGICAGTVLTRHGTSLRLLAGAFGLGALGIALS